MKQAKLLGLTDSKHCIFCKIARKEELSYIIFEDNEVIVFLDNKPVFPGHCLVIPKKHIENFHYLPKEQVSHFFEISKVLSKAVELGLHAHGTFIAINTNVSQSVPHFHLHVIPRRQKDGLRGFFWPRMSYQSIDEIKFIQKSIHDKMISLLKDQK